MPASRANQRDASLQARPPDPGGPRLHSSIMTPPAMSLRTAATAAVLLALAACGGRDTTARGDSSGGAADTAATFRVALLHPGPTSDNSWNWGASQGLARIRDSLGARVSAIQTKTPAEFEENFRQYGAQGYDLVIGHGFEYQDAAVRVAPEFPKTVYLTTSGNQVGANLAGIEFDFEEPSYLAGLLAGSLTKTGVVGTIGGTELPPVKRSFAAFTAGARRARPDVQVLGSYVGNWDDVNAGKEQALAQVGRRADVIFQNADAAGLGVFQAAKERPGVLVFGSNADQNGIAPAVTVGSVVIDLPRAFMLVAREVKERRFQPRVFKLGGKEQVVTLVLNPTRKDLVTPAMQAGLDSARAGIASGAIQLQ
jgi:basic membrane lipoprotein Med (substrate-binding protein (PBP1-ABC) superfamily)